VALIALRRERESLRIVAVACAGAIAMVPAATLVFGAIGAGAAMIAIELFAASAGWLALVRLGAAPTFPVIAGADLLGMLAMAVAVLAVGDRSVYLATALGGAAFLGVRSVASRTMTPRSFSRVEVAR
jgi:hypothetical protein